MRRPKNDGGPSAEGQPLEAHTVAAGVPLGASNGPLQSVLATSALDLHRQGPDGTHDNRSARPACPSLSDVAPRERRLLGPLLGQHPKWIRLRPPGVVRLVCPGQPRRLRRAAGPHRALRPLDGGGPPPGPGHDRPATVDRRRLPASLSSTGTWPNRRPSTFVVRRSTLSRQPLASTAWSSGPSWPKRRRPAGGPCSGLPPRPAGSACVGGVRNRPRAPRYRARTSHRDGGRQGSEGGGDPPAAQVGPVSGPGRRRAPGWSGPGCSGPDSASTAMAPPASFGAWPDGPASASTSPPTR